ncbi:hypothetical protein E2C01_021276 [Portunus trituberculatus]|uniref:Secreted protein n=1 Tax=Portunus trituberculatus TaxID=210409 RepID=A0A5B7E226_PORTR|nr:hypothetical protein [Portunus trituberculatus]
MLVSLVLVLVVLHEESCLPSCARAGSRGVLSLSSQTISPGPLHKLCLASLHIRAFPRLNGRSLEGTSVTEGERPGLSAHRGLVDCVQVHSGLFLRLASRKEANAGHCGGHESKYPENGIEAHLSCLLRSVLGGAFLASKHHTHLRLYNGNEAVHLADGGVAGQDIGVLQHTQVTGCVLANLEDTTPLGEVTTVLLVLGTALGQIVQALGGALALRPHQWYHTFVHLQNLQIDIVKSSWRYFLLFSSVFSRLIAVRRLPMVPVDSSAAKIPLPGITMALAILRSSCCMDSLG